MAEVYREDQDETPWDMPHDIFWDKSRGATVRRAQWVIDNRPEVSLEYLTYFMALQPEHIEELHIDNKEENNG